MQKFIFVLIFVFLASFLSQSDAQMSKVQQTQCIGEQTQQKVMKELTEKYGSSQKFRIEKGVWQTAFFWKNEDGDEKVFEEFCMRHFMGTPEKFELLFERILENLEVLNGHFNKMILDFKRPLDLDIGEILPIDLLFGEIDPSAHITEDLFKSKIAFTILLNFPYYSLAEKTKLGQKWNRKEWAYARIGDIFTSRVPAEIYQKLAQVMTNSDVYIAEYNIYMGNLRDENDQKYFPEDMKLISHWGLRDELKSHYQKVQEDLPKQKIIYEVMKRIIRQEIPAIVINNNEYLWNPYQNKVLKDGKEIPFTPEPNTRYQHFLNNFKALREIDKYYPHLPTYILRKFEVEREISEADIEKLFTTFMTSEQVKATARLIQKRLGRNLEPFDIWYDGFKSRSFISQEKLDSIVSHKYPNIHAFENEIKVILNKLGYSPIKADFIASKITVDPARGAGHAWGAEMRTEKSHLRTRVPKTGMNYKGFNIAMHELGHNVEQTLTLHKVEYYSLKGVPNTAFTEAFAFVFQGKDMNVLEMESPDPNLKHTKALDTLWAAYEIMGVSLVDMKTWNWIYQHPDATPEELKQAILAISIDVWNQYYAENFGLRDEPILAIYSHMISYPLYLPDYPLGHLIEFQIEKYLEDKNMGTEMERMCVSGRIVPQLWMENAVGSKISIQPLLNAAQEALKKIE